MPPVDPMEEGAADGGDPLFVTALARGLAVLRCFTPRTRELSATELARMTKLPQPTIWRLCHTLRALGYLTQAPGGDRKSTRLNSSHT